MKSFNCWIFLCKSAPFQKELLKSTHFGYNNKTTPDLHFCINEEQTNSIEKETPSSRHIPDAFNSLFPQQNSSSIHFLAWKLWITSQDTEEENY